MQLRRLLAGVAVCVVLFSGNTLAQVTTGTILGAVSDSTGAVIPGANVTIRNVETGISRTSTTDMAGRYRAPQLGVGTYEVTAEATGFQTIVRSGITLTVGREAVVDFSLQVGAVAERITVTGEAPLVETTTSSVSQVMEGDAIREIPLNGRSFDELALLQPGVLLTRESQTSTSYGQTNRYISMSGSRANANVVLLDGTNINAFWNRGGGGAAGQQLGIDAIREFRLITSTFSAEYGRSAGGVMNVVTRSGTNELHGSAFEFLRNSAMDARTFTDFLVKEPPPFKRNQFGATLGGPIVRDRTFYYGAWEGLRQRTSDSQRDFVPSNLARGGTLPGGKVTVASAVQPYLALYPSPNGPDQPDGTAEYNFTSRQTADEDFFQIRIDHQMSQNHSLFGRYTFDNTNIFNSGGLAIYSDTARTRNQYLTLNYTAILSPTVLNSARFGFNRSYASGETAEEPAILRFGATRAIGQVSVSGVASLGFGATATPYEIVHNLFEYSDDVSIATGRHSLKFGGMAGRIRDKYEHYYQVNGQYIFRTLSDFLQNRPTSVRFGLPGSDPVAYWRQMIYGFYVQDDLQATNRLTLNLGLRYEFVTNPINVNVAHNNMVANVPDLLRDTNFSLTDRVFRNNPSLKNFGPRFGFAWDVFGNGRTAVRGGAGIVYEPIMQHYYTFQTSFSPLTNIVLQTTPRPTFPNPLVGLPTPKSSDFSIAEAMDYNYCCPPQVIQISLTVQQELPGQMGMTLGYVGSKGTHTQYSSVYNIPWTVKDATGYRVPRTAGQPPPPRRNPNLGATSIDFAGGNSFYSAFQFSLQKRPSYGLSYGISYTWSKNMDAQSGVRSREVGGGGTNIQNPDCLACNWAVSDYDRRHVFSLNSNYELPIGSNRVVNLTGIADKLFGGWQISNVLRMTSGLPLTANVTFDRVGNYGEGYYLQLRPDLKPGYSNNPMIDDAIWNGAGFLQYIDLNAFQLQPEGYFGNIGRNTIFGPGNITWDIALVKKVSFGEGKDLQFRAEFFNVPNLVNLGTPNMTIYSAASGQFARAGQVRSTGDPRKIQLGLKFTF
ncbi:MAG: TonB-dependent receptor [Acidobacteria bacterium]|nr:TonB-dependent receptor [Acidobacteriota bacterium]